MLPVLPARPSRYSLPFLEKREETPTAMTFWFSTKGSGFSYRSNQAIRLILAKVEDPWGPARSFSLSSSPTEADRIAVTCKMTGSPFKEALRGLRPGDRAEVVGPLGDLVYDPSRPTVMIAGGIGITPFRGMLRYASDTRTTQPIVLLYSARTPEEFAFRAELDALAETNPNVQVRYTITRPQDAKGTWQGRVGRIDAGMIREASSQLDHPNFLVVGLPEMIEGTVRLLESSLGVPEERINWEPFRGY